MKDITEYLYESMISEQKTSCSCSLLLPLLESDAEFINKKTYNLSGRFEHWNNKLFNNEIKLEKGISFGKMHRKGVSGSTYYMAKRRNSKSKHYTAVIELRIVINDKLKLTQEYLDMILIHEMIHAYYAHVKMYDAGHGDLFIGMAKDLSKKVGFEIPLKDNNQLLDDDAIKTKKMGIILFDMGGNLSVMFCSEKVFKTNIDEFLYDAIGRYVLPPTTKITHGIIKSKLWDKYPMLRSLKKLKRYNFNVEEWKNLEWISSEEVYFDELSGR